nr:hypothetical protein [Nonomuraea solani]
MTAANASTRRSRSRLAASRAAKKRRTTAMEKRASARTSSRVSQGGSACRPVIRTWSTIWRSTRGDRTLSAPVTAESASPMAARRSLIVDKSMKSRNARPCTAEL